MKYLIIVILLVACQACTEEFNVDSCYVPESRTLSQSDVVISDLVSSNFNPYEEVFVIELFSPAFHSAVFFTVEDRTQSFRFNFYNSRVDILKDDQLKTIDQINIDNFIAMIKSDNNESKDISSFTSYSCYKFVDYKLIYSDSKLDYRIENKLAIKNNLTKIRVLLDTYEDKRERCWK